jgi:hypothetical protein
VVFALDAGQQRDVDFFVKSLRTAQAGQYVYVLQDAVSGVFVEIFVRVVIDTTGRRLFYLIDGDNDFIQPAGSF